MNAKPIFDALAALKAVRELPFGAPVSPALWSQVMTAEVRLNAAVETAALQVPVEAERVEA